MSTGYVQNYTYVLDPNGGGNNIGKYTGNLVAGVPTGKGVMVYNERKNYYANIEEYNGEWSNGLPNGKGIIKYRNGGIYEGYGSNLFRNGKGAYKFPIGDNSKETDLKIYEGDFVDNNMTGRGKITYKNGVTYEGDVYSALKHGRGFIKEKRKDGTFYIVEGTFNNDAATADVTELDTRELVLPKTIVISANVHGGFIVDRTGQNISQFELPSGRENFTLRTINAVSPNVLFYCDFGLLPKYVDAIGKTFSRLDDSGYDEISSQKNIDAKVLQSIMNLKTIDALRHRSNRDKLLKIKRTRNLNDSEKKELDFYVHHNNKSYQVKKKDRKTNKNAHNKEFVVIKKETGTFPIWQTMAVLNIPSAPNLFDKDIFPDLRVKEYQNDVRINLDEIVYYFYDKGVENVIFYDFSCGSIDYNRGSDRTRRKLARSILKTNGGKRKYNNKKTRHYSKRITKKRETRKNKH